MFARSDSPQTLAETPGSGHDSAQPGAGKLYPLASTRAKQSALPFSPRRGEKVAEGRMRGEKAGGARRPDEGREGRMRGEKAG